MLELNRKSRESRALAWMYFPLAVLVVILHTPYTENTSDAAYYLGTVLSSNLTHLAVPTFFFLSGYLFFAKYERFGKSEYLAMVKKKAWTLLIPYLIWNAISYYGYGLLNHYQGELRPWELHRIFWASNAGSEETSLFGYQFSVLCTPALAPLWFVRDLMVVMVFSPVIWYIIRRLKWWALLLFALVWQLRIGIPILGFGFICWFFFPAGATFSILGKNLLVGLSSHSRVIFVLFFFVGGILCWADLAGDAPSRLMDAYRLAGVMFVFAFAYRFGTGEGLAAHIRRWGECSFFIYVVHMLFVLNPLISLLNRVCERMQLPSLCFYVASASVKLLACMLSYYLLKKMFPSVLGYMVGGRSK